MAALWVRKRSLSGLVGQSTLLWLFWPRRLDVGNDALAFESAAHLDDAEVFLNLLDGLVALEVGNIPADPLEENVITIIHRRGVNGSHHGTVPGACKTP